MKFSFKISNEGMALIKEGRDFLYPNVEYDENQSTVTLELPQPDKSTVGQFMSEIKRTGLLVGKKDGELLILSSDHITEYPYELEAF